MEVTSDNKHSEVKEIDIGWITASHKEWSEMRAGVTEDPHREKDNTETNTGPMNSRANSITNILVSQPEPVCKDSPYARLGVKYELNIDFRPFVEVKPISFAEFRKQKIDVWTA